MPVDLDALKEAERHLEKAIARHGRHLSGSEATSEKSQRQMGKEMREAQRALRRAMASMGGTGKKKAASRSWAAGFVDGARERKWRAPVAGGLADAREVASFPREEVIRGLLVELEHTEDPWMAMRIAMDHLSERLDYYERLERMERA